MGTSILCKTFVVSFSTPALPSEFYEFGMPVSSSQYACAGGRQIHRPISGKNASDDGLSKIQARDEAGSR